METKNETKKIGRGRPKSRPDTVQIGCRIERVIYDTIKARYGDGVNMTDFINRTLKKELGI